MKKIIIFLCLTVVVFSQQSDLMKLKKPVQYSDNVQIEKMVQTILQLYGTSFKYFNKLWNKDYSISKTEKGYTINIPESSEDENKKNTVTNEKISLNIIKEENGNYSLMFDKNEIDKLIDKQRFNAIDSKNSTDNIDSVIYINQFLRDMCIVTDPFTGECVHKVFNRSLATGHVTDPDGMPSPLFYDIEDGLILPYEGGEKLIEIDSRWCSIIHLDRALTSNIWHYGDIGSGESQFYAPTSMTYGREEVNGSTTIYPIYVADQGNSRVILVNYIARNPLLGSGFDASSWDVISDSVIYPYDIGYFKAATSTNDKIWVSEAPMRNPSLSCLNVSGELVQKVVGYKDENTGIIFPFEAGSQLRLSVYNYYFASIAFVDNINNNLVLCPLNQDGTATLVSYGNDYLILAAAVERFPEDIRINSVAYHKTTSNTIDWPYLWVTSGYTPPYYNPSQNLIHCFKVNSNSHAQYLGSTSRPDNTD